MRCDEFLTPITTVSLKILHAVHPALFLSYFFKNNVIDSSILDFSNIDELILDAKAAPIGEISLSDPNWFHENKPKY